MLPQNFEGDSAGYSAWLVTAILIAMAACAFGTLKEEERASLEKQLQALKQARVKERASWESQEQTLLASTSSLKEQLQAIQEASADERASSRRELRALQISKEEELRALQVSKEEELRAMQVSKEGELRALQVSKEEELHALQVSKEEELKEERSIQEYWRHSEEGPRSWTLEDESLQTALTSLLRTSSHAPMTGSRCNGMRRAEVKRVDRICNACLWARYLECLAYMRDFHARHGVSPSLLQPSVCLGEPFPWMTLSKELNETLLWHGCDDATADLILQEGFDPRVSREGCLYGEGTYFASQACKSWQYAGRNQNGWCCVLLCRVVLGDPEYVTGPQRGKKMPSLRDAHSRHKGAYDSFVVNSAADGGPPGQAHREFVIFKHEQAYPEFAIWFTA